MKRRKTLKEKIGETLSTDELADYLGVHSGTPRNWRANNKGPKFIKIGGFRNAKVIYRWEDVLKWEKEFL